MRYSKRSKKTRWLPPRSLRCMLPPLRGGAKVVVIASCAQAWREVIGRDLEVLHALAGLARERYWADGRRLRPVEVVR